ncbi:MAG TPA: tripartite tricarboxylate transporter substrate binding protein [Burkholderiales bacterium]|jgi:tripartite-type tricarboxylate transporter receptor subunit TctC|nr:tripartite tricarboxylate transporter substrate binding protein [Burkholderiales bacterium]
MNRLVRVLAALTVALGAAGACAADVGARYPSQPIRLVVPFGVGGYGDIVGRLVGNALSQQINTPVLVDTRPGASTIVGSEIVARAAPDGYTILLISTTNAVNPSLFKKLPYDPVADFTPVTMVDSTPFAMVVNPGVKAQTLAEFVALARAEPGKLSYGSAGSGSSIHLTGELFKNVTGTDIVHVPYKGSGPAMTDLIGGQIHMTFSSTINALPFVKAGKVRALAVTSLLRSKAAPTVPTIAESGYPGFESSSWLGILAPAKTPPAIVGYLQQQIAIALRAPAIVKAFEADGAEAGGNTPEAFGAYFRSEIAKWAKVVAKAGIQMD